MKLFNCDFLTSTWKSKIAKLAKVNVRQQFELFLLVTVSQATRQ